MADLLTHYVSARLPGGFLADPAARSTLVLGVFLPDLAKEALGVLPGLSEFAIVPSHSALGLFCLSYALSMFFAEDFRRKAFVTLFVGSAIHVAVDTLKDGLGAGVCLPWHPFSLQGVEVGLYHNENILWFLPGNAALLLLIRWASKRAKSAGWQWR